MKGLRGFRGRFGARKLTLSKRRRIAELQGEKVSEGILMRIDLNANLGQTADAGAAGKAGSRVVSGAGSAEAADRAQLSVDQAKVRGLSAAVLELPEIRQERVAAVAEQVEKGSYQVSAQQTAEALLTALTTNRAA